MYRLIEETGRPPGLIFAMWGYFWTGSGNIFESVKNHIKTYISHSIRDRNVKT